MIVHVDDTRLITDRQWRGWDGTPAHEALLTWCHHHGIDPMHVPMDTTITRDVQARQVRYVAYTQPEVMDSDGTDAERRLMVAQLESPPLPFPAEVRTVASG